MLGSSNRVEIRKIHSTFFDDRGCRAISGSQESQSQRFRVFDRIVGEQSTGSSDQNRSTIVVLFTFDERRIDARQTRGETITKIPIASRSGPRLLEMKLEEFEHASLLEPVRRTVLTFGRSHADREGQQPHD